MGAISALVAVAATAVLVGGAAIIMYTGLVRKRTGVDTVWSQIAVQRERRYDLVPALVATVTRTSRERRPFDEVIRARTAALAAVTPPQQAKAESALGAALRSVFAVGEAEAKVRSSREFDELRGELTDTENRIAYLRRYYNDAVLSYNEAVQTMPTSVVAGIFGFDLREYFTVPDTDRSSVQVQR